MPSVAADELVRACQQTLPDDTRAFELLVKQCSGRVFAAAYRLMGNPHDADDVAQEVFIKVYHGIKTLADPATFTSWLYRITTNTCLDSLAKQKRAPKTTSLGREADNEDGAWEIYADDRTPTPEEAAVRADVRRCIKRTLAELGAIERAMIVLRDVEERSYQEIAEHLALGLSAVKMRIHRARLAFAHLIETICPDTWRNRGSVTLGAAAPTAQPRGQDDE
ncbi:MAG TPA: RNA polymerase sigma factor [Chloroflexota bacterium]|jgi:RNA polymerase sigma-70 factor (ECF subfamily)